MVLWFLLCLEIPHFDWLVHCQGNLVLEGGLGVNRVGVRIHTHAGQTKIGQRTLVLAVGSLIL